VIGPHTTTVLLFVAVAGLALQFARDWTVRVAGALLVLPRLLAAPLTDGEVIVLGCGIAAAVAHLIFARTFKAAEPAAEPDESPDPPPEDDTSEPTTCVACKGPIPAGADACPRCGWSYTARTDP
jgi:hypothetical protein